MVRYVSRKGGFSQAAPTSQWRRASAGGAEPSLGERTDQEGGRALRSSTLVRFGIERGHSTSQDGTLCNQFRASSTTLLITSSAR
jgi:hypothetical protein